MTAFTLKGTLHGRPVEVSWQSGDIDGDPEACSMARALVRNHAQVGIAGICGGQATLSRPDMAAATILHLMDDQKATRWEGDPLPTRPLPPGAVA